jgi:C4-dicarboxylate-specific signal transduction histidine kinase
VDLNALVRAAVNLDRSWVSDDGTRIDLDLAEDLPPIQADRVLLQQVVVNLIRNAREAMADLPAQRRIITLTTARLGAGQVCVSVRDNGPGVPPDVAPHLFEPFHTSKPHGLGLGLSISRSIIEAHHGRLEMDHGARDGANFRFVLPAG